jgi:hypothetical protein
MEALEDRCVLSAPALGYSSFLPAATYAMAVDGAGEVFAAGNGYVVRLNAAGTAASYLTSLPGGLATGIALDGAGDAYVTGYTNSTTFPTTPSAAYQAGAAFPSGNTQAGFFTELSPSGAILYSTYLPGLPATGAPFQGSDQGGIVVDSAGNAYITGVAGAGLPTTQGAYQFTDPSTTTTAFLAEFNPNLSGLASRVYCTYLGGTGGDAGTDVAVDASGNVYVTGITGSSNFPTVNAYQTKNLGGNDVFVAEINPTIAGTAGLVYSTYLGGSGNDGAGITTLTTNGAASGAYIFQANGPGLALDASGNVYVTGSTRSADFPCTQGAYGGGVVAGQTGGVAFVTKLNPAAGPAGLVYSTLLGTANPLTTPAWARDTQGTRVVVDAAGDAYVTGKTGSASFPQVNPIQGGYGGNADAFVSELNPAGSALLFSTYLGGTYSDIGLGIGLDDGNNAYVAGITFSANLPVTPGAYEGTRPQTFAGFVTEVSQAAHPTLAVSGLPSSTTAGVVHNFTVTALNADGTLNTNYTGTVHFTSSDPQAVLPADYTFTAADQGVHTFTATLDTAGSQSVFAADTMTAGEAGGQTGITVTPAAAAKFVLSAPSSVQHGAYFSVTLAVYDAYGNVATGYTGTVHFSSSDSTATLPANYTFTASDGGVHTFGNLVLRKKGTQTLKAADTLSSALTATDSITVN